MQRAPSPPVPKPTLTPSLTAAALVFITSVQKWGGAEAFRGGREGRTGQGHARGWGAGRGISPSPLPFPSPSSAIHLVIINALQSLNELKPAAAQGWRGGRFDLSLVLAERSCCGVTLRLGGLTPTPAASRPPRVHGGWHACVQGSVSHVGFVRQLHRGTGSGKCQSSPWPCCGTSRADLAWISPTPPSCEARHGAGRPSKL